ncbi:MAG TPA: thioredoxin family protein [Dehalococcoidia bacterium]|nr:thioredoxin family protein [Dehalococcoidia bacterium]
MVDQKESVVTAERYTKGLSYKDFRTQFPQNEEKFKFNYDNTTVSPEDAKALKDLVAKPNGPKKMLVIGVDWCPDVYRGLPVFLRIAEAAGMDLKIVERDQNLDVMNEFLNQGEFQSVPVAIFYTGDQKEIYHFTERPKKANEEMHHMRAIREGKTQEEAKPLVDEFQKGPIWAGWRDATVKEIVSELQSRT